MASKWLSFPVNLTGGLMTSASPLTLGAEMPGSASILLNMEINSEGGYQRVLGYQKLVSQAVPPYGEPVVNAVLSLTQYVIGGLSSEPVVGDTFYFEGSDPTVQTITAINVDVTSGEAFVTVTPGLAGPPSVSFGRVYFTNGGMSPVNGALIMTTGKVIAKRGSALYGINPRLAGDTWSRIDKPFVGTAPLATLTTDTVSLTGLEAEPQVGDLFRFPDATSGKVYRITGKIAYNSLADTGSFTFAPLYTGPPATGVGISFVGSGLLPSGLKQNKLVGTHYRFLGESCRVVCVDRLNRPFSVDCDTFQFSWISNLPAEGVGASSVAILNSALFFSKNNFIYFTSPSTDNDFNPANGAGVINAGDQIVALYPFRETLIIFGRNRILALSGTSSADFRLSTLSDKLGCTSRDSVKEIGGDVLYAAPDGVRFLSDTDRSGALGLNIASRQIRGDMLRFIQTYGEDIQGLLIRNKSQYRLFGFEQNIPKLRSVGYLAVQSAEQGTTGLQWGLINGMKVYSADSLFVSSGELVIFTDWNTPFVYQMERSNRFEGSVINWFFRSAPMMLSDPTLRKTLHKVNVYGRLTETTLINVRVQKDFGDPGVLQSTNVYTLTHESAGVPWSAPTTLWNEFVYDGFIPRVYLSTQVTGQGFVFAIELFGNDDTIPFIIDSMVLEYSQQDRQ
jgi:hypothetical protein